MTSIIDAMRSIIGEPDFYKNLSGNSYTWDYGAMIEYFIACCLLLIVVGSVFKIILKWITK